MPPLRLCVDDEVVQSFIAALQLGLKKRFGGRVDHLRLVTQDEPGKDGGPRRHYVMLYDAVPGGTGYLHQLLAQDAGTLADVLRMALEHINQCSCNQNPEKDGCYKCVYQYRLGSNMNLVSRDRSRAVLTELVGSLDQLEKVGTISDIFINPSFDSVLESRFIESLRRMGGVLGLPPVKLIQDIVNAKSGYVLELGGQRYRIEPQRNLDSADGVSIASKPDFVIWPWQERSSRKPIAVFCDGWTYHQHSLREDAQKRSALVTSGNFWVWSVTHEDVKSALAGAANSDLDSPLVALNRHDGTVAPPKLPRASQGAFEHHAVFQLLSLLACAPGTVDLHDAAVLQMQRNAAWLGFLMVPNTPDELLKVEAEMAPWLPQLPLALQNPGISTHAPSLSRLDAAPFVLMWWPTGFAQGGTKKYDVPGVVVLDDQSDQAEQKAHLAWRQWLQLFNLLQVLPVLLMTTIKAIQLGDLEGLTARRQDADLSTRLGAHLGTKSIDQKVLSKNWLAAIDLTIEPLQLGLGQLAAMNAPLPEIGYELADDREVVIAEAEMAWINEKIVLLTYEGLDAAKAWTTAGWKVLGLNTDSTFVGNSPWVDAVAIALGLTISNRGETK